MSSFTVSVHRTAGAGPGSSHGDIERRMSGYALGSGTVDDTLGPDGHQIEAIVLMREPALPSVNLTATPIGLLHLHLDGAEHPVVVGVLPGQDITPLGDITHPALNEPLCEAIHRLHADHACVVMREEDATVAESVLEQAREQFRSLTGALG